MSETEDNNKNVRKILRDLPKTEAAPDFESRLHRRIKSGELRQPEFTLADKIIRAIRVPAFAYSMLAVVVVGSMSYFLLRQSGVTPPVVPQETPAIESQKSIGSTTSSASREDRKEKDRAGKQTEELSSVPHPETKEIAREVDKRTAADEQVTNEKTILKQEQLNVPQAPAVRELAEPLQRGNEGAGGVMSNESFIPIQKALPIKSAATQTPSRAFNMESTMAVQADSSVVTDSLRRDSLQRAQRQMQLQQILKSKKPIKPSRE